MRCIVCDEQLTSGQSRCECCKFPVIAGTAGTDEERKAVRQIGSKYKKQIMQNISVNLMTYQYKYENGHLKLADKVQMCIFDGARMDDAYPQKICQLQAGKVYELFPKVTYKNCVHQYQVRIKAPEVEGYTYAGLIFEKGFKARLTVGDDKNYSCSENFDLIQ